MNVMLSVRRAEPCIFGAITHGAALPGLQMSLGVPSEALGYLTHTELWLWPDSALKSAYWTQFSLNHDCFCWDVELTEDRSRPEDEVVGLCVECV